MSSKAQPSLANDANASTKGTIYQLYIALQRCFELASGQKIWVERFGDVTVSATSQIETKRYDSPLTDNHPNLWKTLKNWLQPGFDESQYSSLLLCTTQEYGETSTLAGWNEKNIEEKFKVLDLIGKRHRERQPAKENRQGASQASTSPISEVQAYVLSSDNREKLVRILERFSIATANPDFSGIFKNISDVHCKFIPPRRCNDFLQALLGFIIRPGNLGEGNWEITFDEFRNHVAQLGPAYCKDTRIFPQKYRKPDPGQVKNHEESLFVKKIRDIQYDEVIAEAISNYLYANNTVLNEFSTYEIPPAYYEAFSEEIKSHVSTMYRSAIRNATDLIRDSKNFYDGAMNSHVPNFSGFDSANSSFKNGVIHMHFNDGSSKLKWHLGNE